MCKTELRDLQQQQLQQQQRGNNNNLVQYSMISGSYDRGDSVSATNSEKVLCRGCRHRASAIARAGCHRVLHQTTAVASLLPLLQIAYIFVVFLIYHQLSGYGAYPTKSQSGVQIHPSSFLAFSKRCISAIQGMTKAFQGPISTG